MHEENGIGKHSEVNPAQHYDAVYDHYQKSFAGLDHIVLHEFEPVAGPPIHLHQISPPDTPFRLLLTEGMSAAPMSVPLFDRRYAELALLVPVDICFGPLDEAETHPQGWILGMLRHLAKFPHVEGTWVDFGNSVQAGADLDTTFGAGTLFSGAVFLRSVTLWDEFTHVELPGGPMRIFSVFPLYKEELEFRIAHGHSAFMDLVLAAQFTEVLDPHRPNLCGA